MAFREELKKEIEEYIYGHLPNKEWYDEKFYSFIKDIRLRERLIVEYKNARAIYKFFEGMQASDDLLLAQAKTQVIMYVSIQEAVINYVVFEVMKDKCEVKDLLVQDRLSRVDIPTHKKDRLSKELVHEGNKIVPCVNKKQNVDRTKIRYDQKVNVAKMLGLISDGLAADLIKLYEYRNTIHIEAELRKNFTYDLDMGKLAYKRVEGLSMELQSKLYCDLS